MHGDMEKRLFGLHVTYLEAKETKAVRGRKRQELFTP
jgi:hypothetical protein